MTDARRARLVPVAVAMAIGALVLVVHLISLPAQALTDDDDFYAPAGMRYAEWGAELVTSPTTALSKTSIDAAFSVNREHPPLAKYVFGAAHAVLHEGLSVYGALDAARAGTALMVALLAFSLVLWLWRALGPVVAVTSPLVLLSLPRFFVHSEVCTLDVPVTVMIVLVCALFSWAGDRVGRGVFVGVVFGLALLTKLNAPFALIPCVVVAFLSGARGVRAGDAAAGEPAASIAVPLPPPSIVAMVLVGPLVFVLLWPWLWPDVIDRLGGYFAFHLKHYPIYLFFDGVIWNETFAPARATLTMAVVTVPVVVVAAAAIGAAVALRATVALARGRDTSARARVLALVLLQAVVSVGVVALSDVPRYGGEKLFMPFFAFLAVLAGVGVARIGAAVISLGGLAGKRSVVVTVVVAALVVLPGVKGIADTWGGFGLSYYGELIGGLRGAVVSGHERTYYDMADKRLARLLDVEAKGLRVHVEPNHKEYVRTWRWLRRDGVIGRDGFSIEPEFGRADVVVLTHERRWHTYPALLERLRGWPVMAEQRVDGVPLWTVYRRPARP